MGRSWPRMDFEQLLALQETLDVRLFLEDLTWSQYEREWMSLLQAAGYTLREYELGIDRRWDYLDRLRQLPPVKRGLA